MGISDPDLQPGITVSQVMIRATCDYFMGSLTAHMVIDTSNALTPSQDVFGPLMDSVHTTVRELEFDAAKGVMVVSFLTDLRTVNKLIASKGWSLTA